MCSNGESTRLLAAEDEQETGALLPAAAQDDAGACVDGLKRPVHSGRHLGGWKCAGCIIGSCALGCLAYFGILFNLVVYLVQECDQTSAVGANIVTTVYGTFSSCSLLGAFLSDAFLGRLWTLLIFESLSAMSFVLITSAVVMISRGGATSAAMSFLLFSLYFNAITTGPILPNLIALGADQLSAAEEKKYFCLFSIAAYVGQLGAVTGVTYTGNRGWWIVGSLVCTAAALAVVALGGSAARWFRQSKATGNPFLQIFQVLVAACRKYSLSVPRDASQLYEYQGNFTGNPGYHRYHHTATLSFLDKAAVLGSPETFHSWHLCTVSQVEELKSFVLVIPVGFLMILVGTASTQMNSLFEEQAITMNSQVATWLVIPPASLNVFYLGSAILVGVITAVSGGRIPGWVLGRRRGQQVTSLQMQGGALACGIVAMVVAALVESHRLRVAQRGDLLSVIWLVPQAIFVGAGNYLAFTGGANFFYSEVPHSMRSVGSSMVFLLLGAGSYISSILVALVTAITTQGGEAGWIANNLNDGHLDYFYWLLACSLTCSLGIFILYSCSYSYTGGPTQHELHVTDVKGLSYLQAFATPDVGT